MMRSISMVAAFLWASCAWAGDAKVDPSTYVPYTARSNPRNTAKWGAEALPGINRLRKEAAHKVARFKACNGISTSELSEQRSAAPDKWIVVVTCRNGMKFYVAREDISNGNQTMAAPMLGRPA
ncbi:hypothetical protein PMNALOAF_0466 [Methylobacterium adhaesivum]|jgi:hypothetical protein|uniref:PepSY domain-containing protein n=1 Tax=Methylobacterium adhaesivum TaxID=333297 RepID=A0ABT8BF41_9HYPH|nr:hypothetical protein [Methylobacterium adhaesivum]MDN3590165.1 hypothetical protein [Methylobacterium adhaesivum]GJD29234.1 hypothetical protein PMNALOAF_0466 [Methylobacterium adhaesivum]